MWFPRSRRWVRVPRDGGVPADLPPWARDELVRLRLENVELRAALERYRERTP
jgi:hypothetical protein